MKREIVRYPSPLLKEICTPIEEITEEIKTLAQDMLETMYEAPGVGLAGPQVGVLKQIVVYDPSDQKALVKSIITSLLSPVMGRF